MTPGLGKRLSSDLQRGGHQRALEVALHFPKAGPIECVGDELPDFPPLPGTEWLRFPEAAASWLYVVGPVSAGCF